ncbi:GIY-YIG nuclease family protein [Wolbachia endosymbiont (group A) of Conops quadrifasciatus]|uniref:GIY-YIG nuclease family protein n=1 Tax=Wolbachia endosymbiont (group A) of Conops quadrifasciatus TaxID=3066143 RepID=UPI003979CC78
MYTTVNCGVFLSVDVQCLFVNQINIWCPLSCHPSAWHWDLSYMQNYYVYILASKNNRTLYTGITSNLIKRIWENKSKVISGFTSKYNVHKLVHFEEFQDINSALNRERLLKSWKRKWKTDLIEKENPNWVDLYDNIVR